MGRHHVCCVCRFYDVGNDDVFCGVIGLFKPAWVMRWGTPTRVKAFLVYFVLTAMLSAGIDTQPKSSPSPALSPSVASSPTSATSSSVVAALPAPVSYMLVSSEGTSGGSRTRWRYHIVPADADQSELSRQNMVATVIAAAKHCTETGGAALVQVILESQADRRPYAATQLATAEHSPDGKGAGNKISQIPAHGHGMPATGTDSDAPALVAIDSAPTSLSRPTKQTGGGGAHSHNLDMQVKFVDFIIAQED